MLHLNASGQATTVKKFFSRQTGVAILIKASESVIWNLLTDASNYPSWNSTVVSISGTIALGQTIQLVSKLDPKRTFKLKIKEFEPNKKMVWGDAMGNRIYVLRKNEDGGVHFIMSEKIGGPIFPLFAKMIPSFDASFEQFVQDLKKAAEAN